jgi:tRNA-dihydrouridine synthase B
MLKLQKTPQKASFRLRDQEIFPNTILSPMAGVTDPPFRRLCRELSHNRIGLLVSEFVSTDGSSDFAVKHHKELIFYPEERPFGVQIFGRDPLRMAVAAREIEILNPNFIEVNAGCPVPKVAGKGGGAGLLKDLPRLAAILREVKKNIQVPMTLKCRIGWDENSINVFETLHIAEEEGVELLTVHGRTRVQGYNGFADWDIIGEVARRAKIPVVGNGDVVSVQTAFERLEKYSVAGVSIGRGAMHNPWLFGQIADAWEGKPAAEISVREAVGVFQKYYGYMMDEDMPPMGSLGRLKQLAARLCKGLSPQNMMFRQSLLTSESPEIFFERITEFLESNAAQGMLFSPDDLVNLNGKKENEVTFERQFKG